MSNTAFTVIIAPLMGLLAAGPGGVDLLHFTAGLSCLVLAGTLKAAKSIAA